MNQIRKQFANSVQVVTGVDREIKMENISISMIVGGGSILLTLGFFLFKGNALKGFKKIFNRGQDSLKQKVKDLELKQAAKVIEVRDAEKKVEKIKKRVAEVIVKAKKEIEEVGKITDAEKLLEEFDRW